MAAPPLAGKSRPANLRKNGDERNLPACRTPGKAGIPSVI
ncbi:hypothetical protein HMPREF3038_00713 [Akkermansia sp. KLE1797]|nr:hypothetical protein HMPREF3038_00713 [Akkermansia sp. KLE1797]KXU54204.1 hypothetical protein HMPREF3039_01531 [Akkermansia sp. KLE1798]KZA04734.1 hypothetical protein HMPREF1326_01609 [Akkermansia sp. KLE1605]